MIPVGLNPQVKRNDLPLLILKDHRNKKPLWLLINVFCIFVSFFHNWSLFCSFCRLLCHFTSPPLYWQLSDVMHHVIPNQIYTLPIGSLLELNPIKWAGGLGDGCVDHESNAIPPPPPILTRNRHHWALPYSIIIMNSKSYLLFNHSSHEVKVC